MRFTNYESNYPNNYLFDFECPSRCVIFVAPSCVFMYTNGNFILCYVYKNVFVYVIYQKFNTRIKLTCTHDVSYEEINFAHRLRNVLYKQYKQVLWLGFLRTYNILCIFFMCEKNIFLI